MEVFDAADEPIVHYSLSLIDLEHEALDREAELRAFIPNSPEHQLAYWKISYLNETKPPQVKVCEAMSLVLFSLTRYQPESIRQKAWLDNYFYIVVESMKLTEASRLNPDGTCSDEIRIASKMIMHELGIDYPGKQPLLE